MGSTSQRYQTIDLPVLKAHVIEWLRHRVACPKCRHQTWASMAAIPATPFGPRVEAVIRLVTGVYHLSRRVAVSLMSDILGIDISLGAVSAVEERVSEATRPPVEEAWAKTEEAATKHTDGTTWYQAGVLCALWTIATSAVTVFKILTDGKAATLAPLFGSKLGILVSDRASSLNFWAMERRQVCWAHLLRKAIAFSERDGPSGAIGRELLDYITIVFGHWHALKDGKLTRAEFRVQMAPVRLRVEALLERAVKSKLPHVSGSCVDILEHRVALWTFVDTEGVEPTNNHAERELRAFVLWRKRSFGTQSARGNLYAERLMTVAHTARKQQRNVVEFLTAVALPPAQARCRPRSSRRPEAYAAFAAAIGKYLVKFRSPALRTRPVALRCIIGRCSARGFPPTRAASTVIVSPGQAFTAWNSRSASSPTSWLARRTYDARPRGLPRGVAGKPNACSSAALTATCCWARCSRTTRATFASNVSASVRLLVIRQKSHAAVGPSTPPLNGYVRHGGTSLVEYLKDETLRTLTRSRQRLAAYAFAPKKSPQRLR